MSVTSLRLADWSEGVFEIQDDTVESKTLYGWGKGSSFFQGTSVFLRISESLMAYLKISFVIEMWDWGPNGQNNKRV